MTELAPPDARQQRSGVLMRAFVSGAAGRVVAAGAGFAAYAIAARTLGAEQFGIVAALLALITAFLFLDFGISNATISLLSSAFARGRMRDERETLGTTIVFLTAVGLLFLVLGVAACLLLPASVFGAGDADDLGTVRLALIAVVIGVAIGVPGAFGPKLAFSYQRGSLANVVSTVASVVMLALCGVGALLHLNLLYFAVVLAGTLNLAYLLLTLHLLWGRGSLARPSFAHTRFRVVLAAMRPGLPFVGMAVAAAIGFQTDVLVVAGVLGAVAAGTFAFGTRIFSAINSLFLAGQQQAWASTAHALEVGDVAWVRRTFRRTAVYVVGAYLACSVLVVAVGPWAIGVVTNGEIRLPVGMLALMAVWGAYSAFANHVSFFLNGAGVVKLQAVLALAMAAVNLPLSIVLAHAIGIDGPIVASLVAHAAILLLPSLVMLRRVLRVPAVVTS